MGFLVCFNVRLGITKKQDFIGFLVFFYVRLGIKVILGCHGILSEYVSMSGWELRQNRISWDFLYFLMSGWELRNIGISCDS